jgi:hypothetical protein
VKTTQPQQHPGSQINLSHIVYLTYQHPTNIDILVHIAMAMLAVLGTAELLDCVLQQLDPKTLLLAQRVNRQWQKAIQSDPWCQEKLFYTHRSPRRETETLYLWIPKKNRLKIYILSDPPRILKPGRFLLAPMTLNPVLTEEILPLELGHPERIEDQGQRLESITISTLLKSPHGSWRSMFISSPPVTKIIARSVFYWPRDPPAHWTRHQQRYHEFAVEDAAGVRMSSVVGEVLSMAEGFGIGLEKLAQGRLDHWQLYCPKHVHLDDDPSRLQPEDTLALPPRRPLSLSVPSD